MANHDISIRPHKELDCEKWSRTLWLSGMMALRVGSCASASTGEAEASQ